MKQIVFMPDKELYESVKQGSIKTLPEETILLKKIEELNGTDETLEGIYYLILVALFLTEKEDTIFRERLRIVELVKLLYDYEERGLLIKDKYNFSKKHEIEKKQIIDFRKVLMKQLSETYDIINLESELNNGNFHDEDGFVEYEDCGNFWDTKNVLSWDFENDIIVVFEPSGHAMEHLKKDETGFPESIPITKLGIDKILEIEKNRKIINVEKNYIARLLRFISWYAKLVGYFDRELDTIRTFEACLLYDTFDLLGLIQGDKSANNQEKYQYIKRELNKIKTYS